MPNGCKHEAKPTALKRCRTKELMFQDVLLFELSRKPNPPSFSFKLAQKFFRQSLPGRKKRIDLSQHREGNTLFFLDLSATNRRAP